ncbi:MAG: alkaline phosphatase family protein [Elusimicrobiota bacterium]
MRRIVSIVFLSVFVLSASAAGAFEKPRLGVVVVVDQMRADYLERDPVYSGGFKRLAAEGAVFTRARHLHIPTETAPGHAAISTGRNPSVHGIVANDWFDRVSGRETYCVADASYGIGPEHLDGPTLSDGLKASDPQARVFAVSSKDRAAVTLGGRRPDLVLWFDRVAGEFTTSSYYRRPAWLGAFNAKLKASGLLAVKDGKVPSAVLATPALDRATADLASELVRRESVGRGSSTDLLLVSFSGTDTVGHRYGTQASEMTTQLRAVDALLGKLLAQWSKASGGSLVLALTADHGAIPEPEGPMGKALGVKRLNWETFAADLEKALQKRWPAPKPWIVSNQVPHLYLDGVQSARMGLDWLAFRTEAAGVLSGLGGVARVVVADQVPFLDAADPLASALRRSYRPDRCGDLLLIVAENYLLHDKVPGTSHGSAWFYDANVPLVLWGRGVKPGRYDGPAAVVDLAPTFARLLGFDYPPGDGAAVRFEALAASR